MKHHHTAEVDYPGYNRARLDQIADFLGVPPLVWPPEDPGQVDVWRGAFLTHIPLDVGDAKAYAALVRARVAAGECTGVFTYSGPGEPLAPSAVQAALIDSGPPIHVCHSPKNVTDQAALIRWAAAWPVEWQPYVRVAYWQEPAGDFGGDGKPPISDWQAGVIALADVCDNYGIDSMAHLETYSLGPYQGNGGTQRCRDLLDRVADRLVGISWSYFADATKDRSALLIDPTVAFMADYPELAWGLTATGVYVPYGIPPDDPRRVERVRLLALVYAYLTDTAASMAGYYALEQGPDRTRDFYDADVQALLPAARQSLEGNR